MRKPKFGLLPRIALAIVLGAVCGSFAPAAFVRAAATFNALFDQFLKFLVPLVVLGLVAPAIAETGRGAGKMLLATVALAYGSTLFAGFLAYAVAVTCFPALVANAHVAEAAGVVFMPYFKIILAPPFDVTTALALSFFAGLGMVFSDGDVLKRAAVEFRAMVTKTISVALVPLLPVYVFGAFLDMAAAGKVGPVLGTFAKAVVVIFALSLVLLSIQYALAGVVARRNPLSALKTMLPAYFTALGTSSSAATIPVTLRQTLANGVRPSVAGFVIPLCATVHLAGSTLKITCCAAALVLMQGRVPDAAQFAGFICMLGVVMVAAPGVPGGAIMAALGVLESMLGFSQKELAMMVTLYVAMDSFGTACNVVGDGAIALVMDRFAAKFVTAPAASSAR